MIFKTIWFAIVAFLFLSCVHVNFLNEYNLSGKIVYFETVVEANAAEMVINLSHSGSVARKSKMNLVTDLLASSIVTPKVNKKLQKAYSPDSIVIAVSNGIELEMIKYLRINPVHRLGNDSKFIVTTTLKSCKLYSTNSTISISVEVLTQIFDRKSAEMIWEYSETETERLRFDISDNYVSGDNYINNFVQISKLSSLSKKQIRLSIVDASIRAGKSIGKVLREDIAESK